MFTEAYSPQEISEICPVAVLPFLSDELYKVLHLVFGVASVLIIGSIAIPINVANISVFWKMGLSDLSNLKFFVLSIFDFLTSILIMLIPFISPPLDSMMGSHYVTYITITELFAAPVMYAAMACGAWTTAIISMERCICVLLPLKVKLFFTHRTTAVLLLGIFLYQAVVLFINFWAFSVKLETSQATNITNLVLDVSAFDERLNTLAYFYAITIPTVVCMKDAPGAFKKKFSIGTKEKSVLL
ncbi:hypothetical protein RRG08_045795 [Elysia crispata]|uniref:G protein-coupled receptor n=1 Tax=Elysia crispata TaxID=231223 RepID=A0AAE1B018_9GAST|nr:hypothetical protein RRG08_045795 [Elysia crispata]